MVSAYEKQVTLNKTPPNLSIVKRLGGTNDADIRSYFHTTKHFIYYFSKNFTFLHSIASPPLKYQSVYVAKRRCALSRECQGVVLQGSVLQEVDREIPARL